MQKIITTPDPRLRERSAKVHEITDEIHDIISDMVAASLDWESKHPYELSAAMAAPQLGVNKRIIIVRDDLNDKNNSSFTALINPEVIKTEGRPETDYEGCLSVPEIYGLVERPHKARIKALLPDGHEIRLKASGYLARTLLHEIDHLNGMLFIDHIKGKKDAFFRLDGQGNMQPLDYDTEVANNHNLWGDEA